MSKLAAKDSHARKPFKPQIYKRRGQIRSHGQAGYQGRSENGNRGIVQTIIQDKITEAIDSEETLEGTVDRIVEKVTGMQGMVITIETGIGQGKESLQETMVETEGLAMIGPGQGLEVVQIGIG